jgi:tetraprenyl-beta-curcumene synthase
MTNSSVLRSPPRRYTALSPATPARSKIRSPFRDRRLLARACLALLLANGRYWLITAPLVRAQLRHWTWRARAIGDPTLRVLALQKLGEEHFNAEVAAMLATLAPRSHHANAVRAIVALEVLYDYLDGLTESPSRDALRDGGQLFMAFRDAVAPSREPAGDYYRYHPRSADGGYLEQLVATVRCALGRLPSSGAIATIAQRTAARCAEAQTREHAAPSVGREQLENWAIREAAATALPPREFLAGAEASVLALHALIAAAAGEDTTHADAEEIDAVYLSIAALTTMLDSLIDQELDEGAGKPGYIQHYEDHNRLVAELTRVAHDAATRARELPNGAHHVMLLVGAVAYYTSAPSAKSAVARTAKRRIDREFRPLITPTLGVMWVWRAAKRLRARSRPHRLARVSRPA